MPVILTTDEMGETLDGRDRGMNLPVNSGLLPQTLLRIVPAASARTLPQGASSQTITSAMMD